MDLRLLTLDLRQQKLIPVFGAVNIARTQFRRQSVAVTIEQEQRVVADRLKVPVVGAALLLTMNRSLAGIHVEDDVPGAIQRQTEIKRRCESVLTSWGPENGRPPPLKNPVGSLLRAGLTVRINAVL